MKRIFLDSSVLFCAVNSPFGGSAKLFTLKNLSLVSSTFVLTEVERNIRKKLQIYHLERFFKLASQLKIIPTDLTNGLLPKAKKVIVKKDAVILQDAKISRCDFLVTLDKKHFFSAAVKNFLKHQKVLTPKDLLNLLD